MLHRLVSTVASDMQWTGRSSCYKAYITCHMLFLTACWLWTGNMSCGLGTAFLSQKHFTVMYIRQCLIVQVADDLHTLCNMQCCPQELLICSLLEKHIDRGRAISPDILFVQLTDGPQHLLQELLVPIHSKNPHTLQQATVSVMPEATNLRAHILCRIGMLISLHCTAGLIAYLCSKCTMSTTSAYTRQGRLSVDKAGC